MSENSYMAPQTERPTPETKTSSLWLFAVTLCMLPFCFLGYGSDNDTYGVIESGVSTWHLHMPQTSRHPGYWVFEAVVYVLSSLGGFMLTNLAAVAVSTVICWRLYAGSKKLGARYPMLLVICLAATPVYLIASTSTMDYVWSLLCIVLAAEAIVSGRLTLAFLLGALAMGFRAANCLVVAGGFAAAILFEVLSERRITKRAWLTAFAGAGAALLVAPVYVFSYHVAGNSMEFMSPMIGPPSMWSMKMRIGRFLYKGLYVIGPLALAVFVLAAIQWLRKRPEPTPSETLDARRLRAIAWGLLVGNLVLYFKYPIEVSYLIPALFYFLLLAGSTVFREARGWLIVMLACILSLNVVLPSLAQPNTPGKATDAKLHLSFVSGTLIQDVNARLTLIGCSTAKCWESRSANQPGQ
jgi:hypothetical protein